jgi:hypothetical protein
MIHVQHDRIDRREHARFELIVRRRQLPACGKIERSVCLFDGKTAHARIPSVPATKREGQLRVEGGHQCGLRGKPQKGGEWAFLSKAVGAVSAQIRTPEQSIALPVALGLDP